MDQHAPAKVAGSDDRDETEIEPIAIVGMTARVPGAADVDQFWRNLVDGVESLTRFTRAEQIGRGADEADVDDPGWVHAAPVVDGFDEFDAGLFGMSPREAAIMSPQHRLFLESCYSALQDGGYDPARYAGSIGVYAGTGGNDYLWKHIRRNSSLRGPHAEVSNATGNSPNYVATMPSYKLNLNGPSLTVHTACSTSLVALHLACEALRGGECDMALAGGVNIEHPHGVGYLGMDGFTSPDAHCRPFDSGANGTVWGSGVGVTLVKRLDDAVADGDNIRAVIRGNAITNDGADKVGFTAPSIDGQAAAIGQAVGMAGIDPHTIGYVEAHGTGTAMGDPIEITALSSVYAQHTPRRSWCALGSVKSNIGHLSQAAGIVGVIKATLALEHGMIPPMVNHERANSAIDFADTPFYPVTTPSVWESGDTPRRAGVSSFGMGGTNAHVVLEQAPAREAGQVPEQETAELLRVSARTETALETALERLAAHLETRRPGLADVAHTLRVGRPEYQHRASVVATGAADAAAALRDKSRTSRGESTPAAPRVAMLFSGQGSQYAGMGAGLYGREPVFARAVDECAELLTAHLDVDIRQVMFGAGADNTDTDETLTQTRYTQPALFVLEYALARLWQHCGVRQDAMIGHSIGEYVAATVAGVFSLPDALRVVAARGRLMHTVAPGAMLAVQLDESDVLGMLDEGLSIATVNGPGTCVVSGETELLEAFERRCETDKIRCKRLRTSHAFHSAMMDTILADFAAALTGVELNPPQQPFLSNVTGSWITAEQACDPGYWVEHVRRAVRFGDCVATLLTDGTWTLLECGPGKQLCGLSRMQLAKAGARQRALTPLPSLPAGRTEHDDASDDRATIRAAAGALWTRGAPADTGSTPAARRIPLPGYPFERKRHWIDPDPEPVSPAPGHAARSGNTGPRTLPDWFAVPAWRQLPPEQAADDAVGDCLVFVAGPRGSALAGALRARGNAVTEVSAGEDFAPTPAGFRLRPGAREDYDTLLGALASRGVPGRIVHAFTMDGEACDGDIPASWRAQDRGFFSVLNLVQAMAAAGLTAADSPGEVLWSLRLLTSGTADVRGDELDRPEHATLAGLAKVLPAELPGLGVTLIDTDPAGEAATVAAELARPARHDGAVIALRGNRRWTLGYEDTRLAAEPEGPVLREGGCYLITGGLGGIGITLAEDIARRTRGRLVLLSRSGLPDRAQWDEHLATHGGADRAGRAIAAIRRMERAGAEVLACAGDVADPQDLRGLREDIHAAFGGLDGIVHAAGLPGGGIAELKDRAEAERVLAPKLSGTLALAEVFGDLVLDFVVLCSSITSITGGFGQVDYCAANNFLDAYARAAHGWKAPVLAQNWGGWAEVGMAAESEAPATLRAATSAATRAISHPVLAAHSGGESGDACHGTVAPGTHWILDEHRIGGVGVIPGTAHLECVRAAYSATSGAENVALELRDVAFLEPFAVADGAHAGYRVELPGAGSPGEFEVRSHLDGRTSTHVRGSVHTVDTPSPARTDLAAVRQRCRPVDDGGREPGRGSMLQFGPRWDCLAEHRVGDGEELATITAGEAVRGELAEWGLHPALLDVATAFGQGKGNGTYLPLSYGRITVRAALPGKFHSHLRYHDTAGDEVVSADLSLLDDNGAELVAVTDFVLRRVDPDSVTGGLAADVAPASAARQTEAGGGILPTDGATAFRRSLAAALVSGLGAQVAISPRSVTEIVEDARGPGAGGTDEPDATGATGDATADASEVQANVLRIFATELGVDDVGPDDDFFALGGNSLVAVQLIAALRKAIGVALPMRSLFETSTVAGLCARIEELRDSGGAADGEDSPTPAAEDEDASIPALPR